MLDWNRYRDDIAALASDTLGRHVQIDGPVSLTLLPQPMLLAAKVTVGQGGGGIGITAAELRLRVALGALLSGHVDAQELVLRGADMRVPWPPAPDAFMVRAPAWLSSLSARIEDSRLSIGSVTLTGFSATLTTASATGTYMMAGTAQFSGRSWHFTTRLTQPGGDGAAGLDVTLDGQGKVQDVGLSLSGQIAADGTMVGRINGRGPDLSQLLPAPAVPFRAEGRVSVASGLAAADELTVELGGSPARGAVALRITPTPRLDVALTASRLDLDAWLAALLRRGDSEVFPRLPTGIDLSAEAGQLAGGTLRGLRGAFDLTDGAVEVRELRASLPGDAGIRMAGRITLPDARLSPPQPGRFDGHVALTADSLRTTLAWLQGAGLAGMDRLPDGVLRSAQLAGHVVIEAGQIAVDSLAGVLDNTTVSGGLTVRPGGQAAAGRPAIGAGLTVDRLDLDPLLPATLPGLADIPALLSAFDLDLRLEAKQAMLRGVALSPLSLDAAAENGRLTLRKLDFTTASGAHVAASGTLVEGGRIAEGRLDAQVPRNTLPNSPLGAWLNGMLPERLGFLAIDTASLWRAPATVQVLASGAPATLGLKVTADIGDLRLEAQPTLDLPGMKWTGAVTLRHPGAPRLLEALGITGAPAWLGDGSFSLVAQMSVGGGRIAADSFDITAATLHAGGALALQHTETGSSLTGRVTAEALPLPLPYLRSPDPLPVGLLSGWQMAVKLEAGRVLLGELPALEQFAAALTLSDGLLRIEGLTAKLGGGALSGSASLDSRAVPPVLAADARLTGAVLSGPLFDLPLDLTAGTLDGSASLTAAGHSPAALLATLGGNLRLAVQGGMLSGVDLVRATGDLTEAGVQAAFAGGSTPFDRLEATARIGLGRMTLDQAQVTAPSGTIVLTGGTDLPAATADLHLLARPAVPDPPELGLHLNGPFGALRRTPELAGLIRWRAEHPPAR
ncbi:AsmA family protein [Limobrevibacterium gyesilva]|nr:AsmA family protein [Limobrevibacterium gyesilva]